MTQHHKGVCAVMARRDRFGWPADCAIVICRPARTFGNSSDVRHVKYISDETAISTGCSCGSGRTNQKPRLGTSSRFDPFYSHTLHGFIFHLPVVQWFSAGPFGRCFGWMGQADVGAGRGKCLVNLASLRLPQPC